MLRAPEFVRQFINREVMGGSVEIDTVIQAKVGKYRTFVITDVQYRFIKLFVEDVSGVKHDVRVNWRTKSNEETARRYKRLRLNNDWSQSVVADVNSAINLFHRGVHKDMLRTSVASLRIMAMLAR